MSSPVNMEVSPALLDEQRRITHVLFLGMFILLALSLVFLLLLVFSS